MNYVIEVETERGYFCLNDETILGVVFHPYPKFLSPYTVQATVAFNYGWHAHRAFTFKSLNIGPADGHIENVSLRIDANAALRDAVYVLADDPLFLDALTLKE